MKLKYYMRGIGIGMLVTTIILVIAFAFVGNDISDKEVIERAKKLGMVESNVNATNNTANSTSKKNETEGNQTIEGATNPMPDNSTQTNTTNAPAVNVESVEFTISDGDVSRTVIERLAGLGLISDADAFNRYLNEKGYDNNLQNGTFKIKKGISEEELANLLVTKQKFREGV